ncbi:MAG TPA: histidine phosphatase family protein, partial [Methylomirabilota bacterium]|nr:histidine phosphatase family protein [Methylomirabilota bacterium]
LAVRHGATEWSQARRFAGSRDIPLIAQGRLQAEAVAQALGETVTAAVYTSPLERARMSADVIAKRHRLDPVIEPAFREMAFGVWEGLTREEVATRFPAEFTAWASSPDRVTPPDGESLGAVDSRVRAALGALVERHRGQTAILVSHAIVLRLIVLAALGLGPERLWSVDASPAGITEIEYQGDWATVHRMNTLTHLDGLREDGA